MLIGCVSLSVCVDWLCQPFCLYCLVVSAFLSVLIGLGSLSVCVDGHWGKELTDQCWSFVKLHWNGYWSEVMTNLKWLLIWMVTDLRWLLIWSGYWSEVVIVLLHRSLLGCWQTLALKLYCCTEVVLLHRSWCVVALKLTCSCFCGEKRNKFLCVCFWLFFLHLLLALGIGQWKRV